MISLEFRPRALQKFCHCDGATYPYKYSFFSKRFTSTPCIETEDGSQISIETANTTYVLERITENTALYNHGWQFSREEAMDDIIKYLSSQDEEYFAERETTKSKVLSDDAILADLRDEHYKCVMNFGNDRDWSCRDACDNDPGIVR